MSATSVPPANGSGVVLEHIPASMGVFTGPVTILAKECTLCVEREQDKTRLVVEAFNAPMRHGFVMTKEATRNLIRLLQASL